MIGLAGGSAKLAVVDALGAHGSFDYTEADWTASVRTWLGDRRVTVALDGVGGSIGREVLDLIAPGGRLIMFGYSSGAVLPMSAGDLFHTGVTVSAAIGARIMSRPGGIKAYAEDALNQLAAGHLTPVVHPPFPLAEVAEAHGAPEARATTGKVVLVP